MARFDYFHTLSELSDIMEGEVAMAFDRSGHKGSETVSAGKKKASKLYADTQKALWEDMIPPLERRDIASVVNSLLRIINTAYELQTERSRISAGIFSPPLRTSCDSNTRKKGEIYSEIAREIGRTVALLGNIRRMKEPPSRYIYDLSLNIFEKASSPHGDRAAYLERKLGDDLSICYDRLVEVIYNNL